MAQNVIINGVTYSSVPKVQIPKSGGGNADFYDTASADATSSDILASKKAYGASGEVTGSIQSKSAQTYTPGTTDQTISAGQYLSGAQTIKGSTYLVSANIKNGITLFGVSGKSTVVDTEISSNAASASTVISGKKAYVNGTLITGEASMPTIAQDSSTHVLSIS